MFKLLVGTCRITCTAGSMLLVLAAGSAQSEPQRVAQKPLQVSAGAAERGAPAQDRPMSEVEIDLTQEEAAWLAGQPEIVLGTATEYPPLVFRRADGTYDGMLVDLYEQLNRRLDNKLRLHIEDPWSRTQETAKDREIDGLALGGRAPNREAIFNSTDILVPTYFSVFARSKNAVPIVSVQTLTDHLPPSNSNYGDVGAAV